MHRRREVVREKVKRKATKKSKVKKILLLLKRVYLISIIVNIRTFGQPFKHKYDSKLGSLS